MKREWLIWAWGGLSFMVGLVLLTVWQTVRLNEWFRGFFDLLQKPEQQDGLRQFWGFAQTFAWIAFPYIFLRSLENLLASHYVFRWRQALTTEYLPRWKNTPTEIEGLGLIRAVITLLSFIPILWGLSTDMTITWLHFDGSLLWLALLAAIGGTVISWVVGRLLPELEYNNQKVEAAFRKKLVYAEDQRDCLQAMIIFPYLLMAPSLFSGLITLGVIQQVGNAFGKIVRV
eukprot:gene16129-16307_t